MGSEVLRVGIVQSCIRKFRLDFRKNFFIQKVVKHCNRLPREVVNTSSLIVLEALGLFSGSHMAFEM